MRTLISLFILFLIGINCSKDPNEQDLTKPVIAITNPTSGQVYNAGDMILISGTITDNKFIAEAHIHITNTNTGALLMDIHLFPNGPTTDFNQSIVASAGFNYKIQVIAKDRAVNETINTVMASCN
jgi:hypothetical protein